MVEASLRSLPKFIPTEREEILDRYLAIPVTPPTYLKRRAALDALQQIGGLVAAGA